MPEGKDKNLGQYVDWEVWVKTLKVNFVTRNCISSYLNNKIVNISPNHRVITDLRDLIENSTEEG